MVMPVIFLSSLNINRGGVTKAALKRANMFAETHGKVIIATTLFQYKHKQIINELRERNELSENVVVYNFFEDLRKSRPKPFFKKKIKHQVDENDYITVPVKGHPKNSYRYYKNGFYKMYKRFEDDQLDFIDYMDDSGKRIQRSEFDENGLLVRERFMDCTLNKSRFDKYYDYKGNCMLSVHVNPRTNKDSIAVHFSKNVNSYTELYHLQASWLSELLGKFNKVSLFCELRGMDDLVYRIKHPNIEKIAVIHSSHLDKPFDDITKVRPAFGPAFAKDKFDKYVFLTESQLKDVESHYGKSDKYLVIPHSYEMLNKTETEVKLEKDPNKIVYIARYAEDKRIHEAIHSFSLVVNEIPEAKLYLYGLGPLKKELKSLINRLNLNNNVLLKGYTNDPQSVYRSAACSIITSRREGFGLVIIESMAEGTPVVAYDYKYGPRDIIKDNVDGFIVENGNRNQLAKRIIDIIQDEKLRNKLSENALLVRDRFSEEKYRASWLSLLK